jgi:hypothetical protein
MENRSKQRTEVLKGEGVNSHILYGAAEISQESGTYETIELKESGLLRHEDPNGNHAEHHTLFVESGRWVMGRQVEFNPFEKKVTRVWD